MPRYLDEIWLAWSWRNPRTCKIEPKQSGNSGRYLRVLNCASENGLSLETCGRLWVLVTPKSGEQQRDRLGGH
jgi:hypothetical protein